MTYREAIEWCTEHAADVDFTPGNTQVLWYQNFEPYVKIGDTFLSAIKAAMKKEEELNEGN